MGYHNHNQEFLRQIDGRFPLEIFAELLDPGVSLELDLYWASAGGADVVALLDRLGDRVTALHVKDGTLEPAAVRSVRSRPIRSPPARASSRSPRRWMPPGSPQYAIVEFDAYPGDIWQGVTTGYEFLDGSRTRLMAAFAPVGSGPVGVGFVGVGVISDTTSRTSRASPTSRC